MEKFIPKRNLKAIKAKAKVLVILGPTASGKTSLGAALAAEFNGEIVSADSRQVYKGLDVGTGKDLSEYKVWGKKIIYHLIDVVGPKRQFDVARYQSAALKAIAGILERGRLPIIVGGSGLYLQALVDNYRLAAFKAGAKRAHWEKLPTEELLEKIAALKPGFAKRLNNSERHNARRLARYLEIIRAGGSRAGKKERLYDFLLLGLTWPDEVLRRRIAERLQARLEKEDLIGEVKALHKASVSWPRLAAFGLEYKFVSRYLKGELGYEEMAERLATAIYRFAKRQKTWFKRWEKQGTEIKWIKDKGEAEKLVGKWL